MTSISDCIQRAIDAKELNPGLGREAQSQFDQLVARYEGIMPRHQAEASAAADLKEATRRAARSRYHAVLNQLQAMRRISARIEGSDDPAREIRSLIESELHTGNGASVRFLKDAYTASINAGIAEVLNKVSANVWGASRDRKLLFDLIDELHGDETGNAAARAMAEAVRYQQRRMRQRANAHGMDIGELADYGIQHRHDAIRIAQAGFEAWAAKIAPRLAWHRIEDVTTGRPFAAEKGVVPPREATDRFLRDVFDGIVTRGWDDRSPSLSTGGTELYNRRADRRVLHFNSGADWRAYNDEFGGADPFSGMMDGLHGLARDVALMEVLGPNPKAGLEFAIQTAEKLAAKRGDARLASRVATNGQRARTDLAVVTGAGSVPEHAGMAAFLSGTRTVLTSVQLGSAVLSSTTDSVTSGAAARIVGMKPGNVASRTIALITSAQTRQTAARLGYVGQSAAEAGGGGARFMGQTMASGIPERLSGFVMKAQGLTFLTDMKRVAFQMEFSAHLAELADQGFDALPPFLSELFRRRGITPADWDILRAPEARFRTDTGEDFISADYWLETQQGLPRGEAEGLAMRLRMVQAELQELAIPTGRVAGRARLGGAIAPGTFMGELARSSSAYKNYPFSLMVGQYQLFMATRAVHGNATAWAQAASIGALLTLMGALAIQMKEIAKGNDPRPMTDSVFWMAAVFQGGGLGIFGDFFAAAENRIGGGVAETLAGPVAGLAQDVFGPIVQNATRAITGEDTQVGRDLSNFVRFNTPVGSSLWWMRAAYDRMVADTLQEFLDPDARQAWDRQVRKRMREMGTQPFWKRGEMLPGRGPDLSNALRMRQ